jgi:hypothetical protein
LKFICTEVTSSYRSQKLSCLKFEELPNELVIGTLSYLNMKDLINCSQVSKRFRAIVVDEQGRRKEDLLKIIQDLQCFISVKKFLDHMEIKVNAICVKNLTVYV